MDQVGQLLQTDGNEKQFFDTTNHLIFSLAASLSSPTTMATPKALEALEKTHQALNLIQEKLKPFLEQLEEDDDDNHEDVYSETPPAAKRPRRDQPNTNTDRHRRAVAQSVVALSISTLRVIGARLRGQDQGRNANDPLRQKLNQIRTMLKTVQKLQQSTTTTTTKGANNKSTARESQGNEHKTSDQEPLEPLPTKEEDDKQREIALDDSNETTTESGRKRKYKQSREE